MRRLRAVIAGVPVRVTPAGSDSSAAASQADIRDGAGPQMKLLPPNKASILLSFSLGLLSR